MTREGSDVLAAVVGDVLAANNAHIQHETSGYDMPIPGLVGPFLAALADSGWSLVSTGEVERLRAALEGAALEGRNVLSDATDDQAFVIEEWAHAALPAGGPK